MSELPEPGDVLDGFRIDARLHAGGMGVVYAVSGRETGFPLVMKVPRLGHGEPGEAVVTYEVEQTVLGALRGPHVPRLVAAGDVTRQPYLVMERVEGEPLKAWAERAPLPAAEVARLGAAVATALHALHQQEAIHLDLKPSNVLIRPSGQAVLIDLGLAAHAHYPDLLAEELRRPIGSGPYISPEQVLRVRSDPRSDLFALGVILYELATGRLPFGAPTTPAGLRKRLFRDPIPPRALEPSVPPWLQEIVLRCLEPDARQRHASAAQVAFDLTHPDQVALGERAARLRRRAGLRALLRWLRAAGLEPAPPARPSAQLSTAPIVVAAVATSHGNEAQFEALREVVARLLAPRGETRLACVTVVRPAPELGGATPDDAASRQRIKHLVLLRHWAEPLHLPPGRVSFHVLESADPAAALVDYARVNQVDHVVLGAPPPDLPFKGLLGTIPTRVALEAPCTVSIVRPRAER
ncbi:bifunctional serine/threonine-protein kinase/universal stress protein [Anaeromyxobacter diazotrophicus]|uniref:Serine/threonine protein kinase n=1 Tax=Anaeromyxobacter diazotrophicus TaxID=2590199 RepID=A0A7I9VL57_9BACT|nr:bifunctional serine/threonine-protein kinase/universal stress protein [Anaeromyxobacter diazotrophicus]GEJ56839.1 serine/threonine protein kinase [Anaeromyxobacter diazotrophicus]